ncbi:MAG: hypothetical protein Kow0062_07410 [Acidobacteriota bacterium]
MKNHHAALSILLLVLVTSVPAALAQETCQAVQVIDPCAQQVYVLRPGSSAYARVDLRDGGTNKLRDVAFSTVPGEEHSTSFIAQGHYVRVLAYDHDGSWEVSRTVDVSAFPGVGRMMLVGAAAAPGHAIHDSSGAKTMQYSIYFVGARYGEPYWIALDQEALLSGAPDTEVLVGHGPLCGVGEACEGDANSAVVVRDADGGETLYATILVEESPGNLRERIGVLSRAQGETSSWSFSWNAAADGLDWNGLLPNHLGIASGLAGDVLAAFQAEGVIKDARTGASSCVHDGAPTDVALWGPTSTAPAFQFVTENDPALQGSLSIAPLLACPDVQDPRTDVRPVGQRAVSVALSTASGPRVWAIVANQDGSGVSMSAWSLATDPAPIHFEEDIAASRDVVLGNCSDPPCVKRVAIGAPFPAGEACFDAGLVEMECWQPAHPEPPLPCCLDPDDPDPNCDDCDTPASPPGDGFRRGIR